MKIIELEQSSEAWLDWRKTGIGSSDAPAIIGISPWKTRKELWEEKVISYHGAHKLFSGAQLKAILSKKAKKELIGECAKNRGKNLEPDARIDYEHWTGIKCPAVCGIHDDYTFLKVSLDGWDESRKHAIEIKAPKTEYHESSLDTSKEVWKRVPNIYVPQLWHQFITTNANTIHYVSYHPKYPPTQRLAIVPLERNDNVNKQLKNFLELEIQFWDLVVQGKYDED